MEGVGARFGRSSTRYGPTTAFTGPVRKWKKKWVRVSPLKSNNPSQNPSKGTNGVSNGDNGSRLLFYKWTPLSQSQDNKNADGEDKNTVVDTEALPLSPEEPPRRKFKFVPIAMLEEHNKESAESDTAENVDNEAKPSDPNRIARQPTPTDDGFNEKPDINDTPMEESQHQAYKKTVRQDLNESSLDLGDLEVDGS